MRRKVINKTEDASLWELIAVPFGVILGIGISVIITLIMKGRECLA